ncbi:site-specific integrase [Agromyces sp. NPDC055658]
MATVEPYQNSAGRTLYSVRYRSADRRQRRKRGFKTKRDAERYLISVESAKDRGEWVDPGKSRVTVGEWAEHWYAAQIQLKPTTRSGYRHALDKHVLPRWSTTKLSDVGHADVQKWVNGLSTHLSPSTTRQTHLVLSGVLKFAVRDGRLVRNPCDDIRLPRITRKERGYLTHEQVAALAAASEPYGDVVQLLAYTGLRWGEMAGLKVSRVDLQRRRLDIAEAVTEPRGLITWGTPKTHERRSVPFPEFLIAALEKRMDGKRPDDILFVGQDGGVLRNSNFRSRYFTKALKAVMAEDEDFPRITPHDLRHTAASLAVSAGANVKAVQRMLGHKSAAMTLDVYADLFDDDLDAVADALNVRAVSKM